MTIRAGLNQLVGRESEVNELTAALEAAITGNGGLAMLVGEPGIGKTRLTEELVSTSINRGAATALGACFEGGTTPPYWAWTQVIRSLLTEPTEAVLDALSPRASVMSEIVPEILVLFPGTTAPRDVDPGQARFRLFDSITSFLAEVIEHQPLVIILDDLHWADQSTLDLIEYVVRDISSKRMLIVGSYRDTELVRRHPLSESLAKFARITELQRISLHGLEIDDVGRMVQEIGNISVSPELTAEIHDRTEGNPFFVTEIARDLAREVAQRGGDFDALNFKIPEGVRQAIGIRLNKLSDGCNEMLRIAAVMGREFDFILLSKLNRSLDEDELELIEEANAAGAVREVDGVRNRYEFTHALIQQTLSEELTTGRRVRIHAQIVSSMEELYAGQLDDHAAELLHHATEGVVSDEKIVDYAQLAGERASDLYAWTESRAYFEQAIEAMGDAFQNRQRAEILAALGIGELLTLSYPEVQRGWDHVASAFKIYDELEEFSSAVALARRARGFHPNWLHSTEGVISRALEMVQSDSIDAGHLLVQYSSALRYEKMDDEGSTQALKRALKIAIGSANKHLETRALLGLVTSREAAGDKTGAAEISRKVAVLAKETGQPVEEMIARRVTLNLLIQEGDAETAKKHMEEIFELERMFGFRTSTGFEQLRVALVGGDLVKMRHSQELIDRDQTGNSVPRILSGLGMWHNGNISDLDNRFHAAHEESQFAPTLWQRASNTAFLSLVAWNTNRPSDAIKAGVVAQSIIAMPKLIPEIEAFARIALSMSAILTGDDIEAAKQYPHLSQGRGSIAGTTFYFAGDRILGALAKTAGMLDESAAHFEDALIFCSDPSYQLEAAWTCHDYADLLLERVANADRPANSTQDLKRAREVLEIGLSHAHNIGTRPLESQFITLQEKADAFRETRTTYPDGLTNREVDVLRLIAAGRSNQQISDELVVTLSTTASHVANILDKTSSSNRTEAAAYAVRQGLLNA